MLNSKGHPDDRRIIDSLERSFAVFGRRLPRRTEVGQIYMKAVASYTVNGDRPEVVERAFKWVVNLEFRADDLWKEFGHLLHNAHRYEEAIDAYRRATEEHPGTPRRTASSDIAWSTSTGWPKPRPSTARASRSTRLIRGYGVSSARAGRTLDRPAEAIEAFRKAIEWKPSDGDSRYELARLFFEKLGRKAEAEAEVRKAVALGPKDSNAWCLLAGILYDGSRVTEAEAALEKALSLVREDPDVFVDRANSLAWRIYLMSFKLDEAGRLARRPESVAGERQRPPDAGRDPGPPRPLGRRRDLRPAWAAEVKEADLPGSWHHFILMFRDAVRLGHAAECASLLGETGRELWAPLRVALEKVAGGTEGDLSDVDEFRRGAVAALVAQLRSDERPADCPLTMKAAPAA